MKIYMLSAFDGCIYLQKQPGIEKGWIDICDESGISVIQYYGVNAIDETTCHEIIEKAIKNNVQVLYVNPSQTNSLCGCSDCKEFIHKAKIVAKTISLYDLLCDTHYFYSVCYKTINSGLISEDKKKSLYNQMNALYEKNESLLKVIGETT